MTRRSCCFLLSSSFLLLVDRVNLWRFWLFASTPWSLMLKRQLGSIKVRHCPWWGSGSACSGRVQSRAVRWASVDRRSVECLGCGVRAGLVAFISFSTVTTVATGAICFVPACLRVVVRAVSRIFSLVEYSTSWNIQPRGQPRGILNLVEYSTSWMDFERRDGCALSGKNEWTLNDRYSVPWHRPFTNGFQGRFVFQVILRAVASGFSRLCDCFVWAPARLIPCKGSRIPPRHRG